MNVKKTLLLSFAVLLAGVGATTAIFMTEPTAQQSGAVRENDMLVEVTKGEYGTFQPTITSMGTVEPEQDISLSPRVGGEIVHVADAFMPGGFVRRGEVLVQIDAADYQNTLAQRQSALNQALAELNIEQGRQNVARQDFELLGDSLILQDRSLVLREPQLDGARAGVESARAAVEQAELELERTRIRAPFDAHVLTRNANVGSQVAAGDNLGRLVGVDTYWVVATIPQSQLRWLTFDGEGLPPSAVIVRNRTAWPDTTYRSGTLHRLVGALEDQTRLARVIVDVPDPMAYRAGNAGLPPLMIGSFVEAAIEARALSDVVRLSRNYIRDDDTVWLMEDGVLRIQPVDVVFQDATYAYIASGLSGEDRVVMTNLSTVVDGAALRLEGDQPGSDEGPLPSLEPREAESGAAASN